MAVHNMSFQQQESPCFDARPNHFSLAPCQSLQRAGEGGELETTFFFLFPCIGCFFARVGLGTSERFMDGAVAHPGPSLPGPTKQWVMSIRSACRSQLTMDAFADKSSETAVRCETAMALWPFSGKLLGCAFHEPAQFCFRSRHAMHGRPPSLGSGESGRRAPFHRTSRKPCGIVAFVGRRQVSRVSKHTSDALRLAPDEAPRV
ncbi:hypothetical protein BCR34DRAFT_239367 [Clohesyomyces aquaticus]|uniref:Uncharacterized protein n=1 Tax=Clohesyomyces aquaticus TaxID=1231657 RepID=A0A1Y1ZVY5_9PLEO|nr:hypothetical protein BCR34DRAFT_239367 [Clohesyomyces aquaticus]